MCVVKPVACFILIPFVVPPAWSRPGLFYLRASTVRIFIASANSLSTMLRRLGSHDLYIRHPSFTSRFQTHAIPYDYGRNNCIPGFLLSTAP